MIVLKSTAELRQVFEKLIKTLSVPVEWNGNFVVMDNFLVLSGKERSVIFNYDTRRVSTNIIDLKLSGVPVQSIEKDSQLVNIFNLVLYAFGKWGALKGITVEKDYNKINTLFSAVFAQFGVSADYTSQHCFWYKNGARITYEDAVQEAIESESRIREDTKEGEEETGLWHSTVWKITAADFVFEKLSMSERRKGRLGSNFYKVGYLCPYCSQKLYMAAFSPENEPIIDTVEGRVRLARAFYCPKCVVFYTPLPEKNIVDRDIYILDFDTDEAAGTDYMEMLGKYAIKGGNSSFNEYVDREPEKEQTRGRRNLNGIDKGIRDERMNLNGIDKGIRDERKNLNGIDKGIRDERKNLNGIDKGIRDERMNLNGIDKGIRDERKNLNGIDKGIRDERMNLNGIDKGIRDGRMNLNAVEKFDRLPGENEEEYCAPQAVQEFVDDKKKGIFGRLIGRFLGIRRRRKAGTRKAGKLPDSPEGLIKNMMQENTGEAGQMGEKKAEDESGKLSDIQKKGGSEKADGLKDIVESEKAGGAKAAEEAEGTCTSKKPDEPESLRASKKQGEPGRSYASKKQDEPERSEESGEHAVSEKSEKTFKADTTASQAAADKKRYQAEKAEAEALLERSGASTRKDLTDMLQAIKNRHFTNQVEKEYTDKLQADIERLDKRRIAQACENCMEYTGDELEKLYSAISEEEFLPEIKNPVLDSISRRLTKIKNEEAELLVKRLKRELEDNGVSENDRLYFYPAKDILDNCADEELLTHIENAKAAYAYSIGEFEYPIAMADTTRSQKGRNGMLITPYAIYYSNIFTLGCIRTEDIEAVEVSKGLIGGVGRTVTVRRTDGSRVRIPNIVGKKELTGYTKALNDFVLYLKEQPFSRKEKYLAKEKHDVICCFRCGYIYKNMKECPKCGYKMNV